MLMSIDGLGRACRQPLVTSDTRGVASHFFYPERQELHQECVTHAEIHTIPFRYHPPPHMHAAATIGPSQWLLVG